MASHLDELALRWRRDPSERATIALCEIVRGTAHADIMAEVGTYARDNYASSVPCLVAAARMYMRALRLAEAQSLLVRAGKQAPHEGPIYRLLGEVLLRRGDAERAEKVFERAVAFGITDSETRLWLERSRVFKPMHASAGTRAVAAEVERTSPAAQDGYVPFDSFSESDSDMRDEPTQPRRDIALDSGPSTSRGVAPPLPPAARLPELPLISGFAGASQPAPIAKPAPESPPHHDPTPHADFAHREPVVAKTWDRATPIGLGPPVPRSAGGGMNFAGVPKISDIPNAASFSNRANVSDPNAMPGARGFDPFPQSPAPAHRPTPFFADTRSIDIPVEVPR
ncbi:MAG TPA: hypothetical protein VK636_04015, partial [Gemmatimonadaceae bacterium]|nr:hypothetical protein [Gemmatimonadaceae bacterium]